jgi:hypothetical protein
MAPPCKYNTEEERISAYKVQQNEYTMKDWKCEICDCIIRLGNKTNHLKSQKHFNRANGSYAKVREDKVWECEACDIEIHVHSKNNHLKSARHIRNSNKLDKSKDELVNDENFKEKSN